MPRNRRNRKKQEEKDRKNRAEIQQGVQSEKIPTVPREHSRNGKKDETSMNVLYLQCLRSIILERECPTCERALIADRQGGFSCPAGHIVGWKIGDIHRKVDAFSIKGS